MSLLPFGDLPAYRPRETVPAAIDLGNWEAIEPLFDRLKETMAACRSAADLERWIGEAGELSAALDEESSRRYIAMTCHTDDAGAEKAYLEFVENVEPKLKPRQFELNQLFIKHPARADLPKERYEVFDRDTALSVELFREENVPLETEDSKLGQKYQKLSGSLTVDFRGEEKTLVQMGVFLEETDRGLREEVWNLVSKRRLEERDNFEEIFQEMLALREKIAANAGFSNYRDYMFRRLGRFDYEPKDCETFHAAVEEVIVPAVKRLQARRKEQLKLDVLRPWDTSVDPLGRSPLKPFEQVDEMVERTQKIFDQLDGELAGGFQQMRDLKLLDLDNRKGKAPGGYQSTLAESRLPFIFMNAVGAARCRNDVARGGTCVSCARDPGGGCLFLSPCTDGILRSSFNGHGIAGQRVSGRVLFRRGRQPGAGDASGGNPDHLRVDCDGGRLSALDLHPSGPHPRGTHAGLVGGDGALRR